MSMEPALRGQSPLRNDYRNTVCSSLEEARSVERSVVIAIETDRNARVGGFESWWDVPVAAVSEQESVRSAREQYDVHRAAERWLL